jgi:hypothetical protein
MKTNERINRAFNALKNTSEQLLPENEYEPLNTLKIASTHVPSNRTTFNETMNYIHNELKTK